MKATISYSTFETLDIRVGEIRTAESPDWSHKLLELTVDIGEPELVRIFAGIKAQYPDPSVLVGTKGVFLVNLEPKKMGEFISQGMMLMADAETGPVPLAVSDETKPGTVVR